MNPSDTPAPIVPARQTTLKGLAVIGFIALIVLGLSLAMYSTRYIPSVANRIGSAAVYLGSVFNPAPSPSLSVVPTASTTIDFGTSTASSSSLATNTSTETVVKTPAATPAPTPAPTPKPAQTPVAPAAGTSNTYAVAGPSTPAPHGLSDLAVTISAIGYLTSASTDTFVGSGSVPHGNRPAVKFTITNVGTNWTGTWRFTAAIPTRSHYTFTSDTQQSLAPGESIDYTLGFDQASTGTGTVTITANSDNTAPESNTANNTAAADLSVL